MRMDDPGGEKPRREVRMEIRNPKSEIRKKSEPRSSKFSAPRIARRRSAELHSVVSQICNLRNVGNSETFGFSDRVPNVIRRYSRLRICATMLRASESFRIS